MTQEEKQLLLVDLCGRLPYNIICQVKIYDFDTEEKEPFNHPSYTGNGYLYSINIIGNCVGVRPILNNLRYEEQVYFEQMANNGYASITECKPYLRPMSSMTEEEKKEYKKYFNSIEGKLIGIKGRTIWLIDWLNSHHFDYRGLIEKGLAIEAQEGMYGKEDELEKNTK